MPETYDQIFAKNAVARKLLSAAQANAAARIQSALSRNGIRKTLAEVTVEAGFLHRDRAQGLLQGMARGSHPPLQARFAVLQDEKEVVKAAEDGRITASQYAECERISLDLEKLGYRRAVWEYLVDKGYFTPSVAKEQQAERVTEKRPASRVRKTTVSLPAVPAKLQRASSRGRVAVSAKKSPLVFVAAGGGGALGVLVVVLAILLGGKNEPPPAVPSTTSPKPTPPVVQESVEKKETERRKPEDEGWNQIEERRKKFLEEERAKDEKKTAKKDAKEDAKSAKEEDKNAREEYEKRKKARRDEGTQKLEEAKRAMAEDRTAEEARQKELTERLKGVPLPVRLKNGMQLENAAVTRMAKDEVELQYRFEGAQVQQSLSWEVIDNPSYLSIMEALYKGQGAAGKYEIGRACIARKLWKEAKKAFDACVKEDAAFQDRVPDLTKILNNEGAFQGASKRIGKDGILVSYDFSDADMAQDFKPLSGAKAVVEGGEIKLKGNGAVLWSLKDFEFENEIDVEMHAIPEGNTQVLVGCFFDWEGKGYYLSAGPNGIALALASTALAKFDTFKLAPGAEVKLRFLVRQGTFKVFADDREVFAAQDATYTKGKLYLGSQGGSLRLTRLLIQGKADPVAIDRLFAEAEVLVRRALEGDLSKKKEKEEEEEPPLSVEDDFYFARLSAEEKIDYEKAREEALKVLSSRKFKADHLRLFDPLIIQAPEFPASYYWRARMKEEIGQAGDAHSDYSRALRYAPDFIEAMSALADRHLNELEYKNSLQYVDDAIRVRPDYAEAYAVRGFVKFCTDQPGAEEDLELALKLDPGCRTARDYSRNVVNVRKGPQHLGCKFVREFPHYVVMTDISMEMTKLYGERLEAAFQYYAETFKEFFQDDPKRKKPRVAIFFTKEAYLTYGELTLSRRQEWTLGYFHPMYKELLLFEDADLEETLQTLYHEAFHQFMNLMVGRAPYWYNEGIAEYMGSIKVAKGKRAMEVVERAKMLDGRLKVLQMHLDKALKFKDIMMQTPGQFYAGPVSFKYSQAWAMIRFFYEHENGKYRALIDTYYRTLKEGGDIAEAYEAAFGEQDMDALQTEWTEYVKKLEPAKK